MQKPSVEKAIIVEGRYDRERVKAAVDALVIECRGFNIFNNPEKRSFIKKLAEERGIVILTDSDSAGMMIRNCIKGFAPSEKIINAYIPPIPGKEKRKAAPSKEGLLGVEGMDSETIIKALAAAGALSEERAAVSKEFKMSDLYALGLAGRSGSGEKRKALLRSAGLPENLNAGAFLEMINRGVIKLGDSGIW